MFAQARLDFMEVCLRVAVKMGKPEYSSPEGVAERAKELYEEIMGEEWPYDANNPLSHDL